MQTSQGPPPPYPNQQPSNAAVSNKRFKQEDVIQQSPNTRPATQPVYYLSQQQLQMLQYLQQNQNNLTTQQENVLQQLTNQYRLMQQHQQHVRLQQQRTQSGAVPTQQQPSGQIINRPAGQQFVGQQQTSSFQQTAPRVPQSGTIAQTGFSVDSSGNFPATGHTLPNAGMPYKSANVGTFQQNQFGTNLGYTQISSTTTNQSDMGMIFYTHLFSRNIR